MPISGQPRSFHKKFAFVVEFEGVEYSGFNKCSELEAEIAVIEQREGGALTPDKSPGLVTVSNLTLERGASQDVDLYNWFKQVVNINANSGLVNNEYKRNGEVVQTDRDGTILRRWEITGCWPRKFKAGSWDNDADENVVEMIELVIDGFDLLPTSGEAA